MAITLSRRKLLGGAMASALVTSTPLTSSNDLPKRVLGRTGVQVSILALGCGSRLTSLKEEDRALETINLALDLGITYLDTAQGYGNGLSETWVGKVMKHRRQGVFLATKIPKRAKADEALRRMEESLKRLQTDYVDLVHIHGLHGEDELATIEAPDGILRAMYEIRSQKMSRFIGITSHYDPAGLRLALERHDFDCVQMALNAALQGMTSGSGKMVLNPAMKTSFEALALPVAVKKNLGILAMKVTGQDDLVGDSGGKAPVEKLMRYAWSLPIASAVVGMPKLDHIRQNAELARSFRPMPDREMKEFSRRMSQVHKAALDRKFASHADA